MKFAWQKNLVDIAAWNSQQVKDIEVDTEFQDFYHEEEDCVIAHTLDLTSSNAFPTFPTPPTISDPVISYN